MSDEKKKLLMFLRGLSEKGQGIVEFGVVVAFCVAIGYFMQTVGFASALNDIFGTAASAEFAPADIVAGETKVEGNIAAVDSIGGSTNTTSGGGGSGSGGSGAGSGGSGSGSGDSGSGSGDSGSGSGDSGSGSGDSGSGSGDSGSGSGDSGSGGPAGPGSGPAGPGGGPAGPGNEGGNTTPGMPAGGSTGGESGNTFEEKKAALEAKLKASAVANGTAASWQLGAIVNDNGTYKIVTNAGNGWNNLTEYHIIDANAAMAAAGSQYIQVSSGDIIMADDGNVYFNRYGWGGTEYPTALYEQREHWVKLNL